MRKNFILDTNVLLHDPEALRSFDDNNVILPLVVVEQLDKFKHDMNDLGTNARQVMSELDQMRQIGRLGEGVPLTNGGLVRIIADDGRDELEASGLLNHDKAGNQILGLAVALHRHDTDVPTVLVTKDINLRLRADALGIYAEDYGEPDIDLANGYQGFRTVRLPHDRLQAYTRDAATHLDADDLTPNEYILFQPEDDADGAEAPRPEIGRVADAAEGSVAMIDHHGEGVLQIQPRNVAQCFALNALLDERIKIVTLSGRAGTGKTLLAVAAGLSQIVLQDRYHKLLVSRPTMPMGRDIGYIPGDVEEKLKPWMQPIYDAVSLLQDLDRRAPKSALPRDLLTAGDVAIEPLTYIRGRSIPNQYMIIDEAQNLTPLELKTIITRVGFGSKIVLTGDPDQIDHPYMDTHTNGFVYVVRRFRAHAIAAHVTLDKGERSELAEIAADVL